MRNIIKRFGIVTFVAILGFSIAALTGCSDGSNSGNPIEGTRELSGSGGYRIQVSGTTGLITAFGNNALAVGANTRGYVSIDSQAFRYLNRTGDLTWSGQALVFNIRTYVPSWSSCNFIVSSDRNTLYAYISGSATPTQTYYRR